MSEPDLYAAWARVGGGFTVAASRRKVDLEDLLARTLAAAPSDPRLFWVAASWVGMHHHLVSTRRMVERLKRASELDLAVAGALFSVAREAAGGASQLATILKHCRPLAEPRPLFAIVAANPVLVRKAREGALRLFLEWGFWQDDVSLRTDAIRPVAWVLTRCPELRTRAIFGAGLDAELMDALLARRATVRDLSQSLGTTYAATHEAAARLAGRGWLRRRREGNRQVLTVRPELAAWLADFPALVPKLAATGTDG